MQECDVDMTLYNALLSKMNGIGHTNDFVEFEVNESIRCISE